MKQKIFFIIALSCLSGSLHAVIVFLKGTGCAGKTSLCRELLAIDSSWKVVDEDALYIEQEINDLKNNFPQEFRHIEMAVARENIFHAIKRHQVLFKDSATAQEKTEAEVAIYRIKKALDQYLSINASKHEQWHDELRLYALDSIRNYANAGFNVVVDSWLLKPEHIEMLKQEYKTVIALTYCPVKEIVNRTITRNYHALLNRNLYSMRYFHQALMSFKGLYDFQEERSEQSIDMITREEINNALDVVELSLTGNAAYGSLHLFSREEFSRSQLYEYRLFFMKKFLTTDVLYVIPQNSVDFVVKTAEMSSEQAAQQFLTVINSIA